MGKINSIEKGKKGEREWASKCREQGYQDAERGQQHDGKGNADVIGLPGIHNEVKRVEKLNIDDALDQSKRDAKEGEIPIVAHRKNNTRWKVTMDYEDWFKMYREFRA